MRLGILIRDEEYRRALAAKLSSNDNDIFVNILDGSTKESAGSLILTDVRPEELDSNVLSAIKARTVFLTDSISADEKDCHTVFKYCSVSNLVSELSLAYNEWHGSGPGRCYTARIISVCCETDAYAVSKCSSLARQIIYRHGGRVLILPLSYINDYGINENSSNMLSKLLYTIHTGRERGSDSFSYTDSYGVSTLLLPAGRNPIAYLDEDELKSLTSGLSSRFDTIICDIGTCFRKENISLMRESDHIVFFGTGRRPLKMSDILGADPGERLVNIKITGEADEVIAIDDCIKRIYSTENHDDNKNSDNKAIRS